MEEREAIIAREHHSIYKTRKRVKKRESTDSEKQKVTRLP